ncbi:MAG TPA: hypothetical protein VFT68_06095 [Lapillicoccus sp.]|nr:hypothetical protein [Lapillicoccus sp.]
MPTTRVMATALPYSLADDATHHLTAFVTLKLDPGAEDGLLSDFPAAADWVGTLQAGTWELVTDATAAPLPLTVVPDPDAPADANAWAAALPPTTPVAGFPAPKVSEVEWNSYPANRLSDRAVDLHMATLAAAPTTPPGVLANPAVSGVLDRMSQVSDTIPRLRRMAEERTGRADAILRRRTAEAAASVGIRTGRLEGGYATTVQSQPSPIEVLLDDEGLDDRVTRILDAELGRDHSGDPVTGLMADAHATRRYYDRPEEQTPYRPSPTEGATTPRPDVPTPDFHARVASFGATPVLLQRLGLAVDLLLADPGQRSALANATWVAVRFTAADGTDVTRVAPPRTLVSVVRDRFDALASDAWLAGAVPLGQDGWVVVDLDPDASGLKLDQLLRGLPRAAATEVNGDPASSAPGTLRSSGFGIARTDRVAATRAATAKAESMTAPDDAPGVLGPAMTYDELVRGLRLEVWDDRSRTWHSLHERLVTVDADPGGGPQKVLTDAPDTGFLQLSGLNRVPGSDANPYYLHEVLAGWDGWSLSAPRPGLTIVHGPDGSEQVVAEPDDEPATGVSVRTRVRPASLPRLRWGTSYSFRLLGVDLAGGAVLQPPDPGPGQPPSPDAVLAARSHLERLTEGYARRDAVGLLAAVRDQVLAALPEPPAEGDLDGWTPGLTESPPAAPDQAPETPDWLRTGDPGVDGFVAARVAEGASRRVDAPAPAAAERTRVAEANAAVLRGAASWRVRPQLQVSAEELAAVLPAPVDGAPVVPAAVTAPRPYLRWAPVPPPTLVARNLLTTGEQLSRIVVRSGLPPESPDAISESARHVVPPKTTQLDAETAGKLDFAIGSTDADRQRVAYAISLAERGTLLDQVIPSLDDANGTRTQPDMVLASRPNADPAAAVTLEAITAHRDTPLGEGQYVVHQTDDLVLPYLPDPHAAGVALVFYDAGAPHQLPEPKALQAVVIPFPGDWPRLDPLRLVLEAGSTLGARLDGRAIRVTVPAGEQVRVAMSSSVTRRDLDDFGLWRAHPARLDESAGGYTPEQLVAAEVLARAAASGWTWWLTPSVDLRLVHATPGPARVPRLLSLSCRPRPRGLTVAVLAGIAELHGASTDRLVVRARWTEWVDDLASPGPVQVERTDVVVDSPVGNTERWGVLFLVDFLPFGGSAAVATLVDGDLGMHRAIATFPDTHHRVLTCTPGGATRYAEFFAPDALPGPDSPEVCGEPVVVTVPSSERPAAPEVVEAVPLIRWEESTEPEQPFALRRVRRSGVRVWLRRPWFSSGDGELLGVVLAGAQGGPDGAVSLWGRDPAYTGPTITTGTVPPLLDPTQLFLGTVSDVPLSRAARPVTTARDVPLVDVPETPPATVLGYQPEFHPERDHWFADIALDDGPDLWPFVRLAVARYQPTSIDGCHLSPIGLTSWVQPLPSRTTTVSRPNAGRVRVTVTGVVAFLHSVRIGGVGVSGDDLDADTPLGDAARLDALVATSRVVMARVERLPEGASDLQWEAVTYRRLPVVGQGGESTMRVTWSGELRLPEPLEPRTPGTPGSRWRVVVEEQELLDADDPDAPNMAGQTVTVRRTVYADTIPL